MALQTDPNLHQETPSAGMPNEKMGKDPILIRVIVGTPTLIHEHVRTRVVHGITWGGGWKFIKVRNGECWDRIQKISKG